ncbi:MAG: SWIM zinc finger family protein [Lachnospiraceae bacterium]|nr:SWIM zinc finger family protein [Lachnospiraceae bacterium]
MGLLEIASSKSVWRGIEYYKNNNVISVEQVEDGVYDGIVRGSADKNYSVHVDTIHPRKSTCDCPLANGKMIICKHIVALYIATEPKEEERFKSDLTPYESEEDERHAKRYDSLMSWAKKMTPSQLREAYVDTMIRLEDLERKMKYGKK